MPTTRAPRAAARAAARCLTEVLPTDALGLVLYQLTLAHDIAAVAPTCHALCDAAKLAMKLRPFSSEVVTLGEHPELVYCIAATPDGGVITGCDDGHVRTWMGGELVHAFEAHPEVDDPPYINGVAVLPGERILSCGEDNTVKVWTYDGARERTIDMGDWATCIAALPDGVHFVVGVRGAYDEDANENVGEIRLYRIDGTLVHTFTDGSQAHTAYVWSLAVTLDGQHIISCSFDKLVKVWSVATKSLVSTCDGHGGMVNVGGGHTSSVWAVAVMPDGQRILSGSQDKTVRVWLLDGTHKHTFTLHADDVFALAALPDNQHALSASKDNTVKLFNVDDGAVLRTFKHHTGFVRCLALLPDGRRFVSGSADLTARIVEHGLAPQ